MKNLFMALLDVLNYRGNITSANMYSDGKYSHIKVELSDGVYDITIIKKEEETENA